MTVYGNEPTGPFEGLPPNTIRPGESVLHHWSAPQGRLLLTNLRCLLLSHPHPLHREVEWETDLERIRSLEVTEVDAGGMPDSIARQTLTGVNRGGGGPLDAQLRVEVNGLPVYAGNASSCGEVQTRIDDARTARCMALYGRIVPYGEPR